MADALEHLVVPIAWKAADDTAGGLTGYLSTFGNVDLGGDVVMPGAFDKSIEAINADGGGIPLLADHRPSTSSVLGTIYHAQEDAKGLVIKARFSSAPSAQDIRIKMAEGHVNRLSIGYEATDWAYEDLDGQRVRLLKEIKLWEGSAVVMPMNPEARVTLAKTVGDVDRIEQESLWLQLATADAWLADPSAALKTRR